LKHFLFYWIGEEGQGVGRVLVSLESITIWALFLVLHTVGAFQHVGFFVVVSFTFLLFFSSVAAAAVCPQLHDR